MNTFLLATGLVALAELGDKTQLLSLVLILRFQKPWPILWGILLATVANHAAAAGLGAWVTQWFAASGRAHWLSWILAASFLAMAAWMLVPDKLDDQALKNQSATGFWRVLGITSAAFFMAEMGDKTQIATVMLAAQNQSASLGAWLAVVSGTTAGMLLANAPVLLLGQRLMAWLEQGQRLAWAHRLCAAFFVLMGLGVLLR
jgi:Ca2+/H+ antiporter, TMEM165/GDT1 family